MRGLLYRNTVEMSDAAFNTYGLVRDQNSHEDPHLSRELTTTESHRLRRNQKPVLKILPVQLTIMLISI